MERSHRVFAVVAANLAALGLIVAFAYALSRAGSLFGAG